MKTGVHGCSDSFSRTQLIPAPGRSETMQDDRSVTVLRLGHRPGRDDRMTTHVGLTARALGAERVIFPDNATDALGTTRDVTERFGGPFEAVPTESPVGDVRAWKGPIVHLTMYGEPVQDQIPAVREAANTGDLLVVVGSEKVPFDVYEAADWNLGVTNQPHSEVAALAVFLDRFFQGEELEQEFVDAKSRVVPQSMGKQVEDLETTTSDDPE